MPIVYRNNCTGMQSWHTQSCRAWVQVFRKIICPLLTLAGRISQPSYRSNCLFHKLTSQPTDTPCHHEQMSTSTALLSNLSYQGHIRKCARDKWLCPLAIVRTSSTLYCAVTPECHITAQNDTILSHIILIPGHQLLASPGHCKESKFESLCP